MGVSRVEADPENRTFVFSIATEAERADGFERFEIPAGEWASFEGDGNDPTALIRAETEAFMNRLPTSGYRHDPRPEIGVYPEAAGGYVGFRLPLVGNKRSQTAADVRTDEGSDL